MIRYLLIGVIAGARSMTPLAAVSDAAYAGRLPADNGAPWWLGHPLVAAGSKLLAAGELWGDKWKSAPDRIVPAGLAARLVTASIAGAALAPRKQAVTGAVVAATAAVLASYITWNLRMRALREYGQASSGIVEDVMVVGATAMVVNSAR